MMDRTIISTIQNHKPQICQQSCHTPLKRISSMSEEIISLMEIENLPFSNSINHLTFYFHRVVNSYKHF